jgi:hypothetical protein
MARDYFINVTKQKGEVLYANPSLDVEFNDIAELDKITAHMTKEERIKYFKEFNNKMLRGQEFILETPNNGSKGNIYKINGSKGNIYKIFVNETTEKTSKYLDKFDDFIDERIQRSKDKVTDKTCKLELARTDDFEDYVNEMLDDILRGLINKNVPVYEILSVRSLITDDAIRHIVKAREDYECLTASQKEQELRHISRSLTGYKALRGFVMEYIRYKNGQYGGLNNMLYIYSSEFINGKYYLSNKINKQLSEDIKRKVKK